MCFEELSSGEVGGTKSSPSAGSVPSGASSASLTWHPGDREVSASPSGSLGVLLGVLVVRTQCFCYQGPGFNPW